MERSTGTIWLNARDLYRDLAKWEEREPFTDWFNLTVQADYKINEDWIVEGEGDNLIFKITQAVADQIAKDDAGPPVEQMRHYTRTAEFSKTNWNQQLSEQTHAITGDDDG